MCFINKVKNYFLYITLFLIILLFFINTTVFLFRLIITKCQRALISLTSSKVADKKHNKFLLVFIVVCSLSCLVLYTLNLLFFYNDIFKVFELLILTASILPLLSSLLLGFYGYKIGVVYGPLLSTIVSAFSAFLFILALYVSVINNAVYYNISYKLFSFKFYNNYLFDWIISYNNLSLVMCLLILFITFNVSIYSINYMKSDLSIIRFFSYLNAFSFFMVLLVVSDSAISLLFAWEGVGLLSFLLITFWWTRASACKAGFKAIIINKIGDIFLMIFFFIMFTAVKSFNFINYSLIFYLSDSNGISNYFNYFEMSFIEYSVMFLVLAGFVKSAQLFFHVWLPDAMEGPTPVSALLHSATMVIAGVYLLLKFFYLFEAAPFCKEVVWYTSLCTIILSSLVAITQNDIKKIIAYSTCSQIGFMYLACSLSGYTAALFHLVNHAFFKSLLFLIAGAIIHNLNNEQDIRRMGGLRFYYPTLYILFLIAGASLIGFPFLSGFYSKDLIINLVLVAFFKTKFIGVFSLILFFFSVFLTGVYMFRLLLKVFFGKTFVSLYIFKKTQLAENYTGQIYLYLPMFILAFMSITSGIGFKNYFILNSNSFNSVVFNNTINYEWLFSQNFYSCLTNYITIIFFLLTVLLFTAFLHIQKYFMISFNELKLFKKIYSFFNKKAFFDEIYNIIIVRKFLNICLALVMLLDKKVLNFFIGGANAPKFFFTISKYIIKTYNNNTFKFQIAGFLSISLLLILYIFIITF